MIPHRFRLRSVLTVALATFALTLVLQEFVESADDPGTKAAPVFETDIRPILKAYCLDCHGGAEKLSGGLDLRLRRFIAAGGESGPAIDLTPGHESLIVQKMRAGEMPPSEKKVPADKIRLIESWIAAGAPTAKQEPEKLDPGIGITAEERS